MKEVPETYGLNKYDYEIFNRFYCIEYHSFRFSPYRLNTLNLNGERDKFDSAVSALGDWENHLGSVSMRNKLKL